MPRLGIGVVWLLALLSALTPVARAQDQALEGRVTRVVREETVLVDGQPSLRQELEILITGGEASGQTVLVRTGGQPTVAPIHYREGDKVMLSRGPGPDGSEAYTITDFVRRDALLWLFGIFVVLTLVVARWQGLGSLAGLGLSFLVLFWVVLPLINQGRDPVLVALLGALLIAPITFFISHGVSRKTVVAVVGTLIALALTGVLAQVFINAAQLSGFASEEAGFLQVAREGALNIRGLLLAGMIIGTLGVLDDITISQAAIVQQLKAAAADMTPAEQFGRAMSVGRDHIAALVNTLVLVYTGAALPLLLLFIGAPRPFAEVINYEMISEEVVRTLVGSIGLIAAVPITTALAIVFATADDTAGHDHHGHDHGPRKARRQKPDARFRD